MEARLFTSSALDWQTSDAPDFTCAGSMGKARALVEMWNRDAKRKLKHEIDAFRPDVVHIIMFLTQLSPSILDVLEDLPTLYNAETYRAICPTGLRWRPDIGICHQTVGLTCKTSGCFGVVGLAPRLLQRLLLKQRRGIIDQLVVPSRKMADLFAAHGWPDAAIVTHSVPAHIRKHQYSVSPRVAYAGRLVAEKGIDWFLRSIAHAGSRLEDARFDIIGDGPQRQQLQSLARQLGISNRVTFKGHVSRDETQRLLEEAWVQVVPSLWAEPFGLVAAEALARGTASIVSDAGGPGEIVEHMHTGLVVRTGDIQQLADAMVQLVANADIRKQFAINGETTARNRYSEQNWIDQVLAVYDNMLGRLSRTP
jgi:glycosyltransferase involved in cell wall biosynthesis